MHRRKSARRRQPRFAQCCAIVAWVVLALCIRPAEAQQTYILTDEDTWKPERAVDPTSPEGQLSEARRTLAAGDPERAEVLATQWIDRYPRHPLLPDAYLLRGDAKAAAGDEYKALFDYEYICRVFPGSETFVLACQRELEIAEQYANGRKRKQWGIRMASADEDAEELLIRIQERLPGSRLGEQAGMVLADYYFNKRQMGLAAEAYDLFILNYPQSALVDKARRRLIYSYLATFKGPEFSASGLYEARDRLKQLQVMQPADAQRMGADALLTRIDESDAAKMLSIAQYYFRTGEPISSEYTIRRLVKRYPRTSAAAEALRFVPQVIAQLPERMKASLPDYQAMAVKLQDHTDAKPPAPIPPSPAPASSRPAKEGA